MVSLQNTNHKGKPLKRRATHVTPFGTCRRADVPTPTSSADEPRICLAGGISAFARLQRWQEALRVLSADEFDVRPDLVCGPARLAGRAEMGTRARPRREKPRLFQRRFKRAT